jgi:hypothetical protein
MAEGDLFRRALIHGIKRCGLHLTTVPERGAWAGTAPDLPMLLEELQRFLTEMGRAIGPPWRQDEKHAALAGWLGLAASRR